MTTHPGLPGPLICDFLSREASRGRYAPGVEFHIGKIEMVANTGTYVDSPFHRYAHGKDLAALPLEERRRVPKLNPDRAPVIVTGALIVRQVLRRYELDRLAYSERDLLDGIVLEAALV